MILLLTALTFVGCGGDPPPQHADDGHSDEEQTELVLATAALAAIDIETVEVAEATVGSIRRFPGRVVPVADQEGMVTSLMEGRIERVMAGEGDVVRRGQPRAVVTGPELGDHIAELQHARADVDRQQRLADRGVGIEKHLLAARTSYAAARQHLRAIGMSADEIEELATGDQELDGIVLRSPTNGIVLERTATLGGPVAPGQVLFRVADLSPVWVDADLYERDASRVESGMDVSIHTPVNDGAVARGIVLHILPDVDSERRVSTVRIRVPNGDGLLRPGMYVDARVATGGDVLPSLPADAVQTDGTESFVVVAVNDSTFRRVHVAAPVESGDRVAMPELALGTRVVTRGAFQISSAMGGVEAGHAH